MLKTLKVAGLTVLVGAIAAIAVMWFVPASNVSRTAGYVDFPGFALGETRKVQISTTAALDPAGSYENSQDRDRRLLDQLRDWCLLTVIAASDLPAKDVSQATYDLPTLREESLRRVALFEYGESRSRVVSDHEIVALVAKGSDQRRREQLAQIADEQRKNLGKIPAKFHVFEYTLEPSEGHAELTRLASLNGADLFTPAYGYHEREIGSRSDLEVLLREIDDLTMARRSGSKIVLGGRKLWSGYAKVGLEEVATIWRGQQGLPEYQGVGFSLDPRVDVAVARRDFESEFAEPLARYFGVEQRLIDAARAVLERPAPKDAQERAAQAFEFTDALVKACAASADAERCMSAVGHAAFNSSYQVARYEGNNLAGTEVGMVLFYTDLLMKLWSFDFEGAAPRSVPGFPIKSEMRLSPVYRGDVERAPSTRLWLEPLDRGYQITDGRESILFARTATRLSARAHDFLGGHDQNVEPHVFNRVFIDWWNDHYDEVARHEPQYQRLNEITKWGVIAAWLDVEGQMPALSFLSDAAADPVHVNRQHRLPAWVASHQDLTFSRWEKIRFDPPDEGKAEYESLALLRSRDIPYFDGPLVAQGGVSLSSRATIAERAATSGGLGKLEAIARRAGVDTRLTNLSTGRLRTLDATTYEFKNYSQQAVSTLARAKPSARLSNAFGEIENAAFGRTVRRTTDGLFVRASADSSSAGRLSGEIGNLRIVRAGRDFRVRWESRDLDLGHSLARRMSTAPDPEAALAAERNLEVSISLGQGEGYLVKARGSDTWIKLAPARADTHVIAEGYHARVAGVGDGARTMDVAWLDGAATRAHLEPNAYLQITRGNAAGQGVKLVCCGRAPPLGASETSVRAAGQEFRGLVDAAGTRYVRLGDLPPSIRSDLATLTGAPTRLAGNDLRLARALAGGEYRQAANELAISRLEYRARLSRIVDYQIRLQRSLHDSEIALAHVDEAIRTVGATPDLAATKALIHVHNGDVEGASAALNAARGEPVTDVGRIVAETTRVRVARTSIEAANEARVSQWLRWQNVTNRSGEIIANAGGRSGRLTLELRVRHLPQGRSIPSSEVATKLTDRNAVVYIHDNPALSNVDVFTPAGHRSLQRLVTSGRVSVRQIELNDVARFRPNLVTDIGTDISARPITFKLNPVPHFQVHRAASSANGDDDDDDDEISGRSRRVYLIESIK